MRSPHRIALVFEEAQVGGIRISEGLEALIAPAILPRGSLMQNILLGINEVKRNVLSAHLGRCYTVKPLLEKICPCPFHSHLHLNFGVILA